MDLSDPTRAVVGTLDGTVLAVLASAGKPLTVGQVAEHTARGSEIGVRRSLARLVDQGIVVATVMGRNQVHTLNREHVAAPVAQLLAELRPRLWQKFRDELSGWKVRPLYASVFGSAARGDGGPESDIDLLLVHPPLPGERRPTGVSRDVVQQLTDAVGEFAVTSTDRDAAQLWEAQVDQLRGKVQAWTGNPLQVVDLSFYEWRKPRGELHSLIGEISRDGVELLKAKAMSLRLSAGGGDGS